MNLGDHAIDSFVRGLGYHVAHGIPWPIAVVLLIAVVVVWSTR